MLRLFLLCVASILVFNLTAPAEIHAEDKKSIQLLKPQLDIGKPLMQVLNERKSGREYSDEKLALQELSNLLWAAFGVNRLESGKRTAPSARNWQEIDIYVATADGLYLYDANVHVLNLVIDEDIRTMTGRQKFVGEAPINLIYVADYSKMGDMPEETKKFYSAADTGFISQNVYLYCASEGLSTVVRGLVERDTLLEVMKLHSDQHVVLAQTVGYPKK